VAYSVVEKYWTGSHTKHRLRYHIVWIPKRRKSILQPEIAKRLREILYEGCQMNKWWIDQLGIQTDHVHVLIQIKPKETVSEVVMKLKGVSSKLIRKEFPELEEFLWGDSLWADGYFATTVGSVNEKAVKQYIAKQSMPQLPRRSPGL